jgi:hypothetical protein
MAANAFRGSQLLHGCVWVVPAAGRHVWHGVTAFGHGVASAATMGATADLGRRRVRYAYLERSEMVRATRHL